MGISLKDYETFVLNQLAPASAESFKSKMLTFSLGLCTEAGEAGDIAKKVAFHGLPYNEELRQKWIKELGDVLFYYVLGCSTLGTTLEEVMDKNYVKLSDRYKSGKFTTEEFLKKEALKNE